jgi:hypothetical protein
MGTQGRSVLGGEGDSRVEGIVDRRIIDACPAAKGSPVEDIHGEPVVPSRERPSFLGFEPLHALGHTEALRTS